MKILIYGLNFAPEAVGVGRYTGEMAQALCAAGHEVRVVTALPYYPEWQVAKAYAPWRYVREEWHGIRINRAPLWVPHFPNGRKRVLHLLSFAVASLPLLVRACFFRPDLIWMAAPTLVCAPATLLTALICRSRCWIHIQDFEVDVAFDLSVISGSRSRRAILRIESWLLRSFSRVSTISRGMVERALEKGVNEEKVLLVPNWADLKNIDALRHVSAYREQLAIPPGAVIALYSGSMGTKQCIDWLSEIALDLAEDPTIVFVFCGDGSQRQRAFDTCHHLPNVRFLPFQPIEKLGELLGLADIHLLPQRPGASSLVMPSKLTGMLASGRPVVAMADAGSELADVAGSCGVVTEPGDRKAFKAAILRLSVNPELRRQLGQAGYLFAHKNLAADSVLGHLESAMKALISGKVRAAAAEPLNPTH